MTLYSRNVRTIGRSAAVCSLLVLASCGGGGGGGTPEPEVITYTFGTTPGLDGMVSSNGQVFLDDPPTAGDDAQNRRWRGFLSFDIQTIPFDARVVSAVLTVYRMSVTGTPFA